MKCIISRREIIIKEVVDQWIVQRILENLNPLLLTKGYGPRYYFEGSPVIANGGMILTIRLSKDLLQEDKNFIKRYMETWGFKVQVVES